jgi:acyl carrier protein
VLDEHRITGRAVLPGTGHLETVRAAFAAAVPNPAGRVVELRDVAFTQPLAVADDGQCEIRVAFAEGSDGMDFQVTSRTAGEEQAHARGSVGWVAPGDAPVHDLAAIRARCRLRTVEPDRTSSHSGMLSFGPRWSSLRRVEVGVDEELGWFTASEQVAGELDRWVLHPALLDEATSFGTSRGEGGYLPMGYGRLVVRAALPARMYSHLRYRDGGGGEVIVADLTLMDAEGVEVASISEFVLRRVDADAVGAGLAGSAVRTGAELSTPDDSGIAPADGAEALRRMLATDLGAQVAVTATDVRALIAGARSLTQETVADQMSGSAAEDRADGADRADDAKFVAPTTELERTLCALWEEVLGSGPVGVEDDFFDLGGNSLVAVQLIAQVRKAVGEKLPMRSLFEAPTVAGMVASVERLRAEHRAGDATR